MQESGQRPQRADAMASRERFMDAAAQLYVDVGYGGCTIRLIATAAATSLGRLNRHWTGKEALFEDVFERYFTPIHAAQQLRLDAIVQTDRTDRAVLFGEVIRAFFEPALAGLPGDETAGLGHKVYCRALIDPAPEVQRMVRDLAAGTAQVMADLLRLVMPDVDAQTFVLALSVVFGTYLHTQLFSLRVAATVGIDADVDWQRASAMLADMMLNGLPIGR